MLKKIFAIILLLFSGSIPGHGQGYYSTEYWEKYTNALAFDIKLDPVSIMKTSFHFRFWYIGQVIDISKDDSNTISGKVTSYAKEYDEMNMGKRTFFSTDTPIEPVTASSIYQLILSTGLTSVPSGDAIDGWRKNSTGFTDIIECMDSGNYTFKCYFSPESQGSLKEALAIQSFITVLEKDLRLKKIYKSFATSIPFRCFTKGMPEVTCRKK